VDINPDTKYGTPIKEFTEKGIVTADGTEREYDIIALATGFDVVTGGMTNMSKFHSTMYWVSLI
jgi:cation diffusion facilitator CzcD-associated flavoprotein CzcO